MRLDELEWTTYSRHTSAIVPLSRGRNVAVWYTHNEPNLYYFWLIQADGVVDPTAAYPLLDPWAAQAVLYHLLGE